MKDTSLWPVSCCKKLIDDSFVGSILEDDVKLELYYEKKEMHSSKNNMYCQNTVDAQNLSIWTT